jgi:hypothetical protein
MSEIILNRRIHCDLMAFLSLTSLIRSPSHSGSLIQENKSDLFSNFNHIWRQSLEIHLSLFHSFRKALHLIKTFSAFLPGIAQACPSYKECWKCLRQRHTFSIADGEMRFKSPICVRSDPWLRTKLMIFPYTPLLNTYYACRVSDFSPDRLIAISNVFSLEE